MKIKLFTSVWGEKYSQIFSDYCVPSCLSAGNIPGLLGLGHEVKWHIYTDDPEKIALHGSEFFSIEKFPNSCYLAFIDFIEKCIADKAVGFIIMPDFLIGDGTLYNAIKLIEGKTCSLAVPHPRVSWQKVITNPFKVMSNGQLISFAFENAHHCLAGAFDSEDANRTWTGVSIRKLQADTYAVIHDLPTPFLCQFNDSDLAFFRGRQEFNIDRIFNEKLKREGRIKIVGSSEACFFVELTDDNNCPPLEQGLRYNDKERGGFNYFNEVYNIWVAR